MTQEEKLQIIDGANAYIKDKGLTASALAKKAKVNPSYLSNMLRGVFVAQANGKDVVISDYHFQRLADFVGVKLNKSYWPIVPTDQFVDIIASLESAKANGTSGMIIGDTGTGKTHAVDLFVKKHPHHTYRLTVSRLYTLPYIMEKLLEIFGQNEKGRSANKMERIIEHLQQLKYNGEKVIIILDESENLKAGVFGMVKAMYDGIANSCSIMLIGTSELTDKMEKMKRKNKDGMPQFCRRFKAGTRHLKAIDKSGFNEFFDSCGVEDKGLRRLLSQISDNYGELHDYLEPALKEADRKGEELTEDFFRLMFNLPKY